MNTSLMNQARWCSGAVTIASLVLLVACGKTPAPAADAKPAEVSAPLRVVDVVVPVALAKADAIELNGVIAFREESRAAFKTGGVISRVAVREGDVVKPGELLAVLDVAEIDAAMSQAQALYDKALRDLKRGETLRAQEVIAQEVLDNLRTAEQAARASLQAARFNRGTAELRATDAVVVTKRLAEAGEVIGPGQPVLLLGSLKSGLVFRGGLNDAQRVRVEAGGQASVRLDAWPGVEFAASVTELGQAADARTGGYRVELGLKPLSGKTLLAGMVGQARLSVRQDLQGGWVLPLTSVVDTGNSQVTVFVLNERDSIEQQTLPLLQLRRDAVVVGGDVRPQARYVSSGTSYLSEGDTVRVQGAAARSAAP